MLGELLDEQRVAIGCVGDRRHQPGRGAAVGDQFHQTGDLVSGEATERDPVELGDAPEVADRAGVRGGLVGRADGADHDQLVERPGAGEERQQREGRGVGPVEVLEHQDGRSDPNHQAGDGLEQQALLDLRIGAAGAE